MDIVLPELLYKSCLVCTNDVIVFGQSFDETMDRLEKVFGRLQRAKLKLQPFKCSLFQRAVKFLGNVVSDAGIAMQEDKIAAIRDWLLCQNITEVLAFMKLSGYYTRFVKKIFIIALPLYELMMKNVEFIWTRRCQDAFDDLKKKLITGPILALPKNEGCFVLNTDASDFVLGAVLYQR